MVWKLESIIDSKYAGSISYVDPSTIGCNSFSKLDDATLIIIGENNAMNCHPFIPNEKSYLAIERNIWDVGEYSILLNADSDTFDNPYSNVSIIVSNEYVIIVRVKLAKIDIENMTYQQIENYLGDIGMDLMASNHCTNDFIVNARKQIIIFGVEN